MPGDVERVVPMANKGERGWRVLVLSADRSGDLSATISLVAEVFPTINEDDLLGRVHRERVDAVVLEAGLPLIDVVSLIHDIRARQKSTRFLPILVAVDRSEVLLREQAFMAGATDVIDLPIEAIETKARLEQILRSRSWHAQLAESDATLERERRETAAARHELMPREMPQLPGWEFAARIRNLGRFTGDSYDVYRVSPNRVVISVADALGSDVVSLIRLAMVRGWVRAVCGRAGTVAEAMEELNALMLDTFGDDGRFVTLYLGFLDPATARLVHGCAGFIEPVLWGESTSSQLTLGLEGGPPLGVSSEVVYRESELVLDVGSRLILGTHALQREHVAPGSLAERIAAGSRLSATRMAEQLATGEPHPGEGSSASTRDVTFIVIQRRREVPVEPG
jgi:CheY-like chemotaxis protein